MVLDVGSSEGSGEACDMGHGDLRAVLAGKHSKHLRPWKAEWALRPQMRVVTRRHTSKRHRAVNCDISFLSPLHPPVLFHHGGVACRCIADQAWHVHVRTFEQVFGSPIL